MPIQSYQDLEVWQVSMELSIAIYEITKVFPKHELYVLTSQMQRAAISVPANISEGNGRQSTKEFIQFLSIAKGSLSELETYIVLAERLNYISSEQSSKILNMITRVGQMIVSLRRVSNNKLKC